MTTFHGSAVRQDELSDLIAEYLALERLRAFRRMLAARFGFLSLAVLVAGAGLDWLPAVAWLVSIALFLAAPLWMWIVEVRRERHLDLRLKSIDGATTDVIQPTAAANTQSLC